MMVASAAWIGFWLEADDGGGVVAWPFVIGVGVVEEVACAMGDFVGLGEVVGAAKAAGDFELALFCCSSLSGCGCGENCLTLMGGVAVFGIGGGGVLALRTGDLDLDRSLLLSPPFSSPPPSDLGDLGLRMSWR
jgi:hypothetical protein